jgi:HK97 family phage prohead protease
VIRAYSLFQAKSFDEDRRTFSGIATTPTIDRIGDSINPMGIQFRNPLALLHQHDHTKPIGKVMFHRPTEKGIQFDAEIARIDEPASLKERVDVAWAEIKHGLVSAVSIGFRAIRHEYNEKGGIDFQEIEVFELSSVSIPALPDAMITTFKSMTSLSPDEVRILKTLDMGRWRSDGSVHLVEIDTHEAPLPKGAVRLTTS